MLRTCEHVSRQCRLWSFFQCALDLRGCVGFFRRGILRLSSIIFNSPFEYDVIQLKRSFGLTMSLFILCSRTRSLTLWDVIRGNSSIKSPGCIHLIAFVNLVPIATEKVSSIRSNTICCIWNQWKSTLKRGGYFCVLTGMWVFQTVTLHRATNSA